VTRRARAAGQGAIALSAATRQRLEALFAAEDAAEAERLLVERCGGELWTCEPATPTSLERLRFAALRFSGGDLRRLGEALELAHTDWRDLLMAADFGDVEAHRRWQPRRRREPK
jgi:hypothetical protein